MAMPPETHSTACRVSELRVGARHLHIVRIRPATGAPFSYRAGQYASVGFAGFDPRYYSIASRPDEPEFEFHVRAVGGDGVSDHVASGLRVGDAVTVTGPFGDAWLRADHRGPLVAVAGGSGLAAIKSIVETALDMGLSQDIHAYLGVRAEADLYMEERFSALTRDYGNLHFVPVLSEAGPDSARRCGLVSDAVASDFSDMNGFKAYVAGPPPMVEATESVLLSRGVLSKDIHADRF